MSRYHINTKPIRFPPHEKVTQILIPSPITHAYWHDIFSHIETHGFITSTDAVLPSFVNGEASTGTYNEYNPEVRRKYNIKSYWKKKLAREAALFGLDDQDAELLSILEEEEGPIP